MANNEDTNNNGQQHGSLISSLYFAAGAATGLVQGYLMVCRELAHEITGGKRFLSFGQPPKTCSEHAGATDSSVDVVALSHRMMKRISSVPRGLSAERLAAELASDAQVQAALPDGVELQVEFVGEDGEILPPNEVSEVLAFQDCNGHTLTIDTAELTLGPDQPVRGALPNYGTQGVLVRSTSRQEDDVWTAGLGPVRRRRPAVARLCLNKYLMRSPSRA